MPFIRLLGHYFFSAGSARERRKALRGSIRIKLPPEGILLSKGYDKWAKNGTYRCLRRAIRSSRASQGTPGTALELASWLPQKIVVRKVEI